MEKRHYFSFSMPCVDGVGHRTMKQYDCEVVKRLPSFGPYEGLHGSKTLTAIEMILPDEMDSIELFDEDDADFFSDGVLFRLRYCDTASISYGAYMKPKMDEPRYICVLPTYVIAFVQAPENGMEFDPEFLGFEFCPILPSREEIQSRFGAMIEDENDAIRVYDAESHEMVTEYTGLTK